MGDFASAGHMTSFYISSGDWALMSLDQELAPAAWLLVLESKCCFCFSQRRVGKSQGGQTCATVLHLLSLSARWLRNRRFNSGMKAACWKLSRHLSFPLPSISSSFPALEPDSSGKHTQTCICPCKEAHFSHLRLPEVSLCLSPAHLKASTTAIFLCILISINFQKIYEFLT